MRLRYATLGLLLILPSRAEAQAGASGTLVVRRGGTEIGREDFSFEAPRKRHLGPTLIVSAKYPSATPPVQIGVRLERDTAAQLTLFQLDSEGAGGTSRILAAGAGARLILRTQAEGTETGRELPGGPDVVLLDENAYALYAAVADLARPGGTRLTAIFPRSGRRASFTARRDGNQGAPARISMTGEITGTLTVDASGRLERLEFPAAGVTVSLSDR